jgi:Tol biopolymer transport system component
MQSTRRFGLALVSVALLATVSSAAARPSAAQWRILLTSNREGDSEIYSVRADGRDAKRLTRSAGFDGFASWSPDGRRVLYYSQVRRTGWSGGIVMNADGSGKRRLPANGSWSPDGRRIVYGSKQDGNGEIYVMNADGSGQRLVVARPSTEEWSPEWSPTGRTIAFVTDRDGNREIYAMNVDGSGQRNLTRSPQRDGEDGQRFLWSPDGSRIAFASNRDGNTEVYVMNADGSGQRRVTRSPAFDEPLAWSPDGRRLAVRHEGLRPRWAFLVMNADGTNVRQVNWKLPGARR